MGIVSSQVPDDQMQGTFMPDVTFDKIVVAPTKSRLTKYIPFGEEFDGDPLLARPFVIWSLSWTASVAESWIKPWSVWFNLAPVFARMATVCNFRCNLKLRIEFSPGIHHRGLAKIWFAPGREFSVNRSGSGAAWQNLGVLLDAGQPGVRELTLPWMHFFDSVRVNVTDQLDDIGRIYFTPISTLARDDGVSVGTVPIIVRAWATDIVMAGPTTAPVVLQSSALSFASKSFGKMRDLPVVGKFAGVASKVADAASSVADLFGWSRPGNVDRVRQITRPPGYAPLDEEDDFLSVTYMNDYGVFGDPSELTKQDLDEMSFSYMAARDSLLAFVSIATTDATGASLFLTDVHPCYAYNSGVGVYTPTSVGFVAAPFRYWRGSLTFTFRVVASQLQSGSVRIFYDPAQSSLTGGYALESARNCVLELKPGATCEVTIGWSNYVPWNKTLDAVSGSATWVTAPSVANWANSNGTLGMLVSAPLISPVSSAGASIAVSMRAGPDFEVMESRNIPVLTWPADPGFLAEAVELQAAVTSNVAASGVESFGSSRRVDLEKHCMGERVVSLRSLLKRYHLVGFITSSAAGTARVSDKTYYSGAWLHEVEQGLGVTLCGLAGTNTMTLVGVTPYAYFAMAFLGNRGGARWRVRPYNSVYDNGTTTETALDPTIRVVQAVDFAGVAVADASYGAIPSTFANEVFVVAKDERVDVRIPDHNYLRYQSKGVYGRPNVWGVVITRAVLDARHWTYACSKAIDEDFSFIGYIGAPNITALPT